MNQEDIRKQEEFDKEQIVRFANERKEILQTVASLMEAQGLSAEILESFAIKLDRLIDLGRYLVIKEEYINELTRSKQKKKESVIVDGVDLNALD